MGEIFSLKAQRYSTETAYTQLLTTIGKQAFYGCSDLTDLNDNVLPSSLETIGQGAFRGTALSGTFNIPESVTTIGKNAFATDGTSVSLYLPVDKKGNFYVQTLGDNLFNSQSAKNYHIYGNPDAETFENLFGTGNGAYYTAAPSLTIMGIQPMQSTPTIEVNNKTGVLTIEQGSNVEVTSTTPATVYVDGKVYDTLTAKNNLKTTIVTPSLGEHTVYVENAGGIKSRTYTINVVTNSTNYWLKDNLTVSDVEYGTPVEPSGCVPLQGTVVYEYSTNPNNSSTWTTDEPTEVGTYWVRAVVEETDDYSGLESEYVKFTISKAENAWEEELTVTDGVASAKAKLGTVVYTYYDAEGNKLDAAPTEPGTYSVVASVAETANYTGLTSDAVEFTIAETNQGWVKNEDGTYSYQDGSEWLMNGIKELPIENGSEETAEFWFVDGVMQKGWYENNDNKIHYFSSVSGAMLKNRWVSVDAEGNYVDWREDADAVAAYYYVDAEGNVVKDVFKYDEACTYGEGEADGHYYAFAKDGAMETGFVKHNGKTYYFSPRTGIMKTGWAKIDDQWYFFGEDGAMATDEVIDGMYYVDANGVWNGETL